MFKNLLIITLKGVQHRPLRSWLTIIGIVIGTMLVVAIMSMSSGIQNIIMSKLQMMGSQMIIVFPGDESNPLASMMAMAKFRERDITDLETISGVQAAIAWDMDSMGVEFRGEKHTISTAGTNWKRMQYLFQATRGFELRSGAWPVSEDANEVVLGDTVARKMFDRQVYAGDEIIIESKRMKVAGILNYTGNADDDQRIYLSWMMFHLLSGVKPGAVTAMVVIRQGADINLVAQQIKFQLSKQDVVDKFVVMTPDTIKKLAGDILSIVELALIMIALVSLLVGAVGIMNTMYTSVLERTKQIGIMKAIGASSESILALFLIESGVIGMIGGLLGIAGGITLALLAGVAASSLGGITGLFSFASLDYLGFLVVLVVTLMTGIIAGILPARQAATMEPAEALRYE